MPVPIGIVASHVSLPSGPPPPTLTSLTPDWVSVGIAVTVDCVGSAFVDGAVVVVDGVDQATTFLSPTTVIFVVDAAAAGTAQVSVRNPDGGTSNMLPLTYRQPPYDTAPCPTPPLPLYVNFPGATWQNLGAIHFYGVPSGTPLTVVLSPGLATSHPLTQTANWTQHVYWNYWVPTTPGLHTIELHGGADATAPLLYTYRVNALPLPVNPPPSYQVNVPTVLTLTGLEPNTPYYLAMSSFTIPPANIVMAEPQIQNSGAAGTITWTVTASMTGDIETRVYVEDGGQSICQAHGVTAFLTKTTVT